MQARNCTSVDESQSSTGFTDDLAALPARQVRLQPVLARVVRTCSDSHTYNCYLAVELRLGGDVQMFFTVVRKAWVVIPSTVVPIKKNQSVVGEGTIVWHAHQ